MNKKILVVEDDTAILETVKEILESIDYTVSCATNGQEALEALHSTSELPSLIILDLKMPKMNGYEFRERQTRDPQIADIPVLLMTADSQIEEQKMKIGATDILKKPLELHSFIKKVKKLC